MDHVVYVDAKAKELNCILDGTKTIKLLAPNTNVKVI